MLPSCLYFMFPSFLISDIFHLHFLLLWFTLITVGCAVQSVFYVLWQSFSVYQLILWVFLAKLIFLFWQWLELAYDYIPLMQNYLTRQYQLMWYCLVSLYYIAHCSFLLSFFFLLKFKSIMYFLNIRLLIGFYCYDQK